MFDWPVGGWQNLGELTPLDGTQLQRVANSNAIKLLVCLVKDTLVTSVCLVKLAALEKTERGSTSIELLVLEVNYYH